MSYTQETDFHETFPLERVKPINFRTLKMLRTPSKFTPIYSFDINIKSHPEVAKLIIDHVQDEPELVFRIVPYDRLRNEFLDEQTFIMEDYEEDVRRDIIKVTSDEPFLITKDYDYGVSITSPDGTVYSVRPNGW